MIAWSRISCLRLAKIASSVGLVLFKEGGCRGNLRFHHFASYFNQGNEELWRVYNFLA